MYTHVNNLQKPNLKPSVIALSDPVLVAVNSAVYLVRNQVEWVRLGLVQAVVLHHLGYWLAPGGFQAKL